MAETQRYIKEGHPDRLVSSPASRVHAEFDGFKPAPDEQESREPEHEARRRGRPAKGSE